MKYTTIKEHHLYDKTFRKGKRWSGKLVSVFVLRDYAAKRLAKSETRGRLKNRYGITVSTKIGGSVVRSRCRRIIRAALQSIEKSKDLKQGFLVVIAARSAAKDMKSTEIERYLDDAFTKIGMYK